MAISFRNIHSAATDSNKCPNHWLPPPMNKCIKRVPPTLPIQTSTTFCGDCLIPPFPATSQMRHSAPEEPIKSTKRGLVPLPQGLCPFLRILPPSAALLPLPRAPIPRRSPTTTTALLVAHHCPAPLSQNFPGRSICFSPPLIKLGQRSAVQCRGHLPRGHLIYLLPPPIPSSRPKPLWHFLHPLQTIHSFIRQFYSEQHSIYIYTSKAKMHQFHRYDPAQPRTVTSFKGKGDFASANVPIVLSQATKS